MARKANLIPISITAIPALTAAAAALAVLVLVVPLPFLKVPQPPAPPPVVTETPAEAQEPAAPRYPVQSWSPLASALDRLRDKAPEVPVHTPETVETPVVAAAPVVPTAPPLGWQFKGTIDGPGSRAALVIQRDGKSRFVFVGQKLPDLGNPGGPPVIVREIETNYMIVDRGDVEERIELQKTEIASPIDTPISSVGSRR